MRWAERAEKSREKCIKIYSIIKLVGSQNLATKRDTVGNSLADVNANFQDMFT